MLEHIPVHKERPQGPYHNFILLDVEEYYQKGYLGFLQDERNINIADDLLRYFTDSLNWIPTLNPSGRERGHEKQGFGLNMYGPTLIMSDGAELGYRICKQWMKLFLLAPEQILLSAGMSAALRDETAPISERFEDFTWVKLSLQRHELVQLLEDLAIKLETVSRSKGQRVVLHFGV